MANNENNGELENQRTAREVHQNYADTLGFEQEIFWDLLTVGQQDILKAKIKELIPDQEKGNKTIINLRETLFTSIWAQRKYSNGNSLTAIIFVLVTNISDQNNAENSKQFSCHPVFRTRKCCVKDEDTTSSKSDNCCMVYIDEVGRVYQNWAAYKDNNVLPKGTMVAPRGGIYSFQQSKVLLETCPTPAASPTKAALGFLDTTTTVGGIVSAAAPIAALLSIPVAAPVMLGATAVGLFATGYTALRSGAQLVDRNQHEQSISLANREARNSWLSVGGGVVGLGALGATSRLTRAAAAGKEVGRITQYAVNGLGVSAIMLSGTGIASNVFDLYLKKQDDEKISNLDYLQLAGSLVLFTHSACNFRMASSIITETQDGTIRQFRENLSNRQRKAFNRMFKETLRIRGENAGKLDVLRGVSEMPTKQQYNDLFKINKELNKRGVRAAFAPNGEGVILNNEVIVNTQELRANVQHNIGPDILNTVTQPIPESYQTGSNGARRTLGAQVLFVRSKADVPSWIANVSNAVDGVRGLGMSSILVEGVQIALSDFGRRIFECLTNVDEFKTLLANMAEICSAEAFRFIMNLVHTFIDCMLDYLNHVLKRQIGSQMILAQILLHISKNYRNISAAYLEERTCEILKAVQDYFLSSNPISSDAEWVKCNDCMGVYQISKL